MRRSSRRPRCRRRRRAAHRDLDVRFATALAEEQRDVLGGFNWSSQRLVMEVVRDGCSGASAGGSCDAWSDVVAGSAVDCAARGSAAVLARRSQLGARARMRPLRPGCRRRLAAGGSATVAGCRQSRWPRCRGVICRLLSGRRSRSFMPSVSGCVRSLAVWVGPHRRSRGSCAATRPRAPIALEYRATTAQWHAERRASRPKVAKLAANDGCASTCRSGSPASIARPDGEPVPGPEARWIGRRHGRRHDRRWAKAWSPEQIANRLRIDFPDDESMRISHEAIYQALYVQGRGALKRELVACLRTGRALRVPRARTRARGKQFVSSEVMISERPGRSSSCSMSSIPYGPDRVWRTTRGRIRPRVAVAARLRLLRPADRARLGSDPHGEGLGGADEPTRLHPLRRTGRRPGRLRHRRDGAHRPGRPGRHSPQLP